MLEDTLKEITKKMDQTIEAIRKDLAAIRTGRANLGILEGVEVEAYGTRMPLNQVAGLAVQDASLLTVKPFDQNQIEAIEKAILQADLGINPVNDGKIIKLPIPQMTEERRKDVAKKVNDLREEGKISLRNIRHQGRDQVKELQQAKEISEDDEHRAFETIQKLTDEHSATIDRMADKKEKEVLEM